MRGFFGRTKTSLAQLWQNGGGLNLSSVRPAKWPYILAYSFKDILYQFCQYFNTHTSNTGFFGLSALTCIFVGHMALSLIIMLLWSKKFKPLLYISVAIMTAGLLPMLLVPDGPVRLVFGIIAMAGVGGAVTCIRCGFAFAINNAERLVGLILMLVTTALMYLLVALEAGGVIVNVILPVLALAALVACLLKFKEQDLEAKEESTKSDAKGLYWALAYFILYFAIDAYIFELNDFSYLPGFALFFAGMLVAGGILVVTLLVFKKSVWHLWNLFFGLVIAMTLFAILEPQIGSPLPHYIFGGLSIMGWPLCMYMLAGTQRRFASYKLLKISTLVYVILSPVTVLSNELIKSTLRLPVPLVAFVYVMVVVTALFLATPFSYKYLFSAAWLNDLHKNDMELLREKVRETDRMEKYKLTPRETEVVTLLLAAKTGRMIAGELQIAESTVGMHTTNAYKKMGINSRAELFHIFSMAEPTETG